MMINYTTEQGAIPRSPASMAPVFLGVCYSLSTIAVTMVTCRILVKAKLKKLAIEDLLIIISTVVTVGLAILTNFAVKYGFGLHLEDIHIDWWPMYSKYSFASVAFAGIPYPLTKVSMLCFYLRLSQQPTFRKICYGTIAYIVASAGIVTILGVFGCTPLRAGWDHDPALNGRCVDPARYLYVYCAMNIVTDLMLLALPIPVILKMQLNPKTKYGLVAMFAFGITITSISGYNMYAMYVAYNSADPTWDGARSWLWAMSEFNAGIIVACMPSMLLFSKWIRGDHDLAKKQQQLQRQQMKQMKQGGAGLTPVENATIGGGGGGGRVVKKHAGVISTDVSMLTSVHVDCPEYVMRDVGGGEKDAAEVMVVEVPQSSDGGSMC